jgi:CubicO group peptidase (beta-lactamase class C family)
MQQLLQKFNVPGVSIAIIKDFKIETVVAYGVADVETGAPVTAALMDTIGKPFDRSRASGC